MKPFTQTADTLDQELADKIDGILAAHGEDPTQLVGILLDVEAAVERHYIPEAAAYYVAERLGCSPPRSTMSSPSIPPFTTSPEPSLPWRCAPPPPAG